MHDGKELRIIDRDEFNSWYAPEKLRPELKWETEIYHVDVTGEIANVKLKIENQEIRYIDYLNMMKLDGEWWIVNKLSHAIPLE